MGLTDDGYVPEDTDALFAETASEVEQQNSDANPRAQSTYTFALLYAVANTLAENQEISLRDLHDAAYVITAEGEALTRKARNLGIIRREPQKATGVVTFLRDSDATTDYTIPSGTIVETLESDPTQFETTELVTLESGTQSVDATIEALEGGADGNVGSNAIQAMPSPPTGVEEVTNNNPTGDPTLTDTNGNPLREGKDRETDAQLRERTLDTDAVNEAPSDDGIERALEDVSGLVSVNVKSNQTSSTVDGIDPYNTEVIAFGGNTVDIAQTLKDTMSVTTLLRLVGGVNGSKETADVVSDLLDQTITVPITRPAETNVAFTIDVVHDNTYVGADPIKDALVGYVGGTRTDGSTTTGLDIGGDILLNEVENITEDIEGVDYADVTLADNNNDGTDDSTTDSDGVPILPISDTTISRLAADDITLNETAR